MNDFTGRQLIHKILMQAWDFMNLPGHVNYERKKNAVMKSHHSAI